MISSDYSLKKSLLIICLYTERSAFAASSFRQLHTSTPRPLTHPTMFPPTLDSIDQRGKRNPPLLPVEAPTANPSIQAGPLPAPNTLNEDQTHTSGPEVEERGVGRIKSFIQSITKSLYRMFILELFTERWYVGEEAPDDFQESYIRFFFALTVMLGRPGEWNYFFEKFFYDLQVSYEDLLKGATEAYSRQFDSELNPTYERHPQTPQLALWMKHIKKVEEHCRVIFLMCGIVVAVMAGLLQQQSSKIYSDTLWYLIVLSFILAGFSLVVSYELIMRFVDVNGDPHTILMWLALFNSCEIPGSIWNEWTMLALPSTYLLWSIITGLIVAFQMLRTPGTAPEPISGSKEIFMRILIGIVFVSGIGAWYGTRHTMDYYANRKWLYNFRQHCARKKERQTRPEQETAEMTSSQPPPPPPLAAADDDEKRKGTESTAPSNDVVRGGSTPAGEETETGSSATTMSH
ncbi:hypothetical protein CPC08DRAFT_534860 [Agrocybe pediades]|nr:hypothetical protein CPC08DRAFT_534860 [Agrocybe pediades]